MRIALLGVDEELLNLARELAALGHEVAAVCQPGEWTSPLRESWPDARFSEDWEELLVPGACDYVIVGRGHPSEALRGEQIKRLAQATIPLVVIHPACEYIVGYEIEMIRKDLGGVIIPYFPTAQASIWEELRNVVADGNSADLGRVEQLVWERPLVDRTPAVVLVQVARDALVMRHLIGPLTQVSAAGALADPSSVLGLQFASSDGRVGRWSLEPTSQPQPANLMLLGAQGKRAVSLDIPANVEANGLFENPQFTWIDACRSLEVAATVPRCLARGKTIALYNEEHTEDAAFKGTMAVGGCLILLLLVGLMISLSVIEGLNLGLDSLWAWRNLPLLLLLLMAFFLFLQLFGWLARRDRVPAENAQSGK